MHTPLHHLSPSALRTCFLVAFALAVIIPLPTARAGDHDHGHGHGHEEEEEDHHGHDEGGGGHHDHEETAPVELDVEAMKAFGVTVKTAGPGAIRVTLSLNGQLVPHEEKVAHVTPRYPGVVREVRKRIGDSVTKGEVIAVVESNQSLQPYELKSPLDGIVVARHATAGEFAAEGTAIFEVGNYEELFADLYLFSSDVGKARVGQAVSILVPGQPHPIEATVSFLSPVTDPLTQSRVVRVGVANPSGSLQPGMFVTADVVQEEVKVPVAVDASALRTSEGNTVVFADHDGRLEPRPVTVGRKGRDTVEIVKGLAAGERYAAGNTFVLQAELEKGEAEHEH